jgi:integrase
LIPDHNKMTTTTTTDRRVNQQSAFELEGTAYDNFINAIKSKASQKFYLAGLKKFMIYNHVEKVDDLLRWDHRLIEAKLASWIVHMKNTENLAPASVKSYLAAIILFYAMNDIEPKRRKLNRYLPEDRKAMDDRAYTTEEIARLLQFCDYRLRALVLLLASSGIRIGAVSELLVKHLTKIEKYNLYKVRVYAGYKEEHYTFTTPEAATAIQNYFDYRQRYGERLDDNSPVIREQFNTDDILTIKKPKSLNPNGLGDLIRESLHRAGIFGAQHMTEGQKIGQKRNAIPRAHGFRKFFETNLIRAKIQDPIPEMLLGHDIGLKKHYLRLGEEEILEQYLKALDLLTIDESNRLRRKVCELEIDVTEIQKFKQELDDLKALIKKD